MELIEASVASYTEREVVLIMSALYEYYNLNMNAELLAGTRKSHHSSSRVLHSRRFWK